MDMVLESKGVRIVEKKENKNKNSLSTKTMSLDRGCSVKSENTKMPPRPNRTFSRAIKAVVFETILAKRARDRKGYRQDSFGSKSFSVKSEASLNLGSDELMKVEETKPNLETSHSSPPSSLSPSSISLKSKNTQMSSSDFNSGIYFLLISLAITVFWGRVFAILVASTWLYSFPGRYNASNVKPENVRKWSEAECRDNKKKVIMEGLIERKNHHSHRENRGH
ncbi:uncharacterized protein Pyn_04846 [Prunus yedoensis var. nudiflora]|uniref:Uncharacterized protein n=1 Tax=Prunus yedoensis var. nudiflora TaxID=2094558 RepID=A0A314UVD8_PRUYE|nr:uncharacterized protein Pyn_04846 [Prunus yedoensis var. nudiflora]